VTSSEERLMRENVYDYMKKKSSRNKIMFYYLISSYSRSNREMFSCMIVEKEKKEKRNYSYKVSLVNKNCDSSFSCMNHATSILRIREVFMMTLLLEWP
jgi:Na+-transporting NADH:ubiquinone oxidoreductase subunit NqrF